MATFVRVGDKTKAIIRKQGFPTKAKTFLRLTDAKKWAKKLEAQIESGSVDSNVVLRYYTLKDCLKHYFTSCERRNLKALKYIQAHSRIICKAIGHYRGSERVIWGGLVATGAYTRVGGDHSLVRSSPLAQKQESPTTWLGFLS